jgi:cellulose synthase/poly-beta-1,6-N-acetylglucosamine synthase-like glycosyltransferase
VPEPNWLAELLAPFEHSGVVGARGVYRSDQREPVARFVQLEYEDRYRYMSQFQEIDFIDTYSAAYRCDLFLEKGGFDEGFPGASVEDQELSFRLVEHGYHLVFRPSAVVVHRHPGTWFAYARKKFRIGYWKVQVLRRHPSRFVRDTHTPGVVRLQVGLAGLALLGAVLMPVWAWSVWVTGMAGCAFAASAVPFGRHVLKNDRGLWAVLPLLLVTRALALGFGLVCGTIALAV